MDVFEFWLTVFNNFSLYGWILIIICMERMGYIYKQPFWRPGLISDVLYTYQNIALQWLFWAKSAIVIEGILAVLIIIHFFPQGDGFLQGSLANKSFAFSFVTLIFVGETAFYAVHYACHKIPVLWEFHRVHHSSVIVDSFSTSRFHLFERIAFTLPSVFAMVYLGVRTEVITVYFFMRTFMDRYIHSNINGPRWTHKLMISSPHFHRWHHAIDPEARDKNFSGDFIFYDVLFGTAYDPDPKDKPPPNVFGEPGYTNNIIMQQFMPFVFLYERWFGKQKF